MTVKANMVFEGMGRRFHALTEEGAAACNRHLPTALEGAIDAATVPTPLRCSARGCAKRYQEAASNKQQETKR